MENWYIFLLLFCCYLIISSRKLIMKNIQRKRKGEKRKMPMEMLKEFIGKACTISLFNEISAVQGTILAVEENWIKVEEKKRIRIINGDMVRDISVKK